MAAMIADSAKKRNKRPAHRKFTSHLGGTETEPKQAIYLQDRADYQERCVQISGNNNAFDVCSGLEHWQPATDQQII